jgi:hypothetical protein
MDLSPYVTESIILHVRRAPSRESVSSPVSSSGVPEPEGFDQLIKTLKVKQGLIRQFWVRVSRSTSLPHVENYRATQSKSQKFLYGQLVRLLSSQSKP